MEVPAPTARKQIPRISILPQRWWMLYEWLRRVWNPALRAKQMVADAKKDPKANKSPKVRLRSFESETEFFSLRPTATKAIDPRRWIQIFIVSMCRQRHRRK